MEAAVQRTDNQRLQPNGPRVSFNRDVHVKRIGPRSNESTNYKIETTNLQPPSTQHLRRELPADLSEESIRKEAALILAQAERIKCKAEGANSNFPKAQKSIHKRPIPNKFHSLPSRKKKPIEKAVSRSVSDASSKKSKKPSIFNIFSRKSDSNLSQEQRNSRFAESGGRRLVRSKSDVGSYKEPKASKKKNSEKEEGSSSKQLPTQLSPIIENAQKEDYFEELFNSERRKSEAITADEKNATDLKDFLDHYNAEQKLSGNIGYTNHKDLDLVPSKPIAETILALQQIKSKSMEDMHSSQLPPEKPTLTKGLTVNGMVKRLSMERFSPPPTISGPAFSYIRPNEQIIYAQLASDEDRSPRKSADFHTSHRLSQTGTPNRHSTDVLDHSSSHHRTSKITIETPARVVSSPARESFSPGPTMIRIQHSRSPWQQLSPRNLSDEDEGLGVETRKSFEDDLQQRYFDRSKSPSELPIVPVIRSVTPPNRLHHEPLNEINTLSRRRAVLESRIRSRRFASPEVVTIEYCASPERNRVREEFHESNQRQYLSPDREEYNRYHKLRSEEIMKKYSPERTHLDMIAPSKTENGRHTSRYVHTKYYDDGTGGVKEIYEREAQVDGHGKPYVRESRRRERIDSPVRQIENTVTAIDYEPKSLDSQFHYSTDTYRSSPENHKMFSTPVRHTNSAETEHWHGSLKRDKRQQRSFDKGDSGIENDFRKESFNGDVNPKWRKRTYHDDIAACEVFIKKERRHTEEQHPRLKRYDFVYRERSIDDGSHYDPRLDKYPKTTVSTLRRNGKENNSPSTSQSHAEDTLKRNKKVGGFQKVKQLFSGGNRKKDHDSGITVSVNGKSESSINDGAKDKYMVKEEEMRSRYREHRGSHQNDLREPKNGNDISMRRRLSTPKASPLLKRTSSEVTRKHSPLVTKNSTELKPEKHSWFKSIDRRSKSKSKEKVNSKLSGEIESSNTLKRNVHRTPPLAPPIPPKNFRFFGDTDLESNPPTISRVNVAPRSRPSVSTLNRTQKYSQSAYDLDRINQTPAAASSRFRSNSLQNLEEDGVDETDTRKRRHYSRSRNLDDISESGSETEDQYKRQPLNTHSRSLSKEKLDRTHRHDDRRSNERHLSTSTSTLKRSPVSVDTYKPTIKPPPKPARSSERRFDLRDPDRLPDSSGTEGESSMQSQRSVVYLHATTVGAIPQPYQSSSRRRATSREDLRKNNLQPMTRTVSRSVSMLAPWKPKHLSEGYEINYSQEQNEKAKKLSTLPRKSTHSSSSTLTRNKKIEAPARSKRQPSGPTKSKDDMSSIQNSSTLSAPKSSLSSTMDHRKETLRRK